MLGLASARPNLRNRAAPQWQRLLLQHGPDRRAGRLLIEAVLRDQIAAVVGDRVGVLQDLEPLEVIVPRKAHADADDLQEVHDTERVVALVRAELAVVGVIERDQRVDAGGFRGIELVLLQLAAIGGERTEIVAHHADGGLVQVDQLDARHRLQNVLGCLDRALDAGVAVQGDAHRHLRAQMRLQPIEMLAQEQHEGRHLERLRAAGLFHRRQGRLGELHVAARAPRHDLA